MSSASAHVLLHNGHVYAPPAPSASALLTVGASVARVGDERLAAAYADGADQVIDLEGRLLTPAFVDAHVHLELTGLALASTDLSTASSLAEALGDLETSAADLPAEGAVHASGWDESTWPERRAPTAAELDAAVGDRVAYVSRVDGHSAVLSSALLKQLPEVRGEPGYRGDGLVERDAHHVARDWLSSSRSDKERSAALRQALESAARSGIGCVHELNAPHISPYRDFELIRRLRAAAALPEVVPYWGELFGGVSADDTIAGFAGDLSVDGSIGSRTAALREPYEDADSSGHLYLDAAQIRDHVVHCTRRGLQAGFHVIGDSALDEVVEGLRQAASQVGTDAMISARHRLEHVEMPDASALSTLAELGVVASVQPAFDAAWGFAGSLYEQRLGASRAAAMNPLASMQRAGIALAFGSDSPVTRLDPWGGVRAAASHSNPGERISVTSAFSAATAGGHFAARRDDAGVLSAGSPATYAVWDVPAGLADGLPNLTLDAPLPRCVRTVVGGAEVFTGAELSS